MEYSCETCNRDFKENRIKYEYHLTTSGHKRNISQKENTPTNMLLDMVKTLKQQVQSLTSGNSNVSKRENKPLSFNTITKHNLYSKEQIINRKNTDLMNPSEKWNRFIFNAYEYQNEEKFVSCGYSPLEKAANLLITKFYKTPQELLPIVVLNNTVGRKKKIAYYDGEKFTVKSDILKKESLDLYTRIDMYLFKSFAQIWLDTKLREIYRTLPIEIRNKVHYRETADNKISFLDFKCCCVGSNHVGCYKDILYKDGHYEILKYKDRDLKNVDGKLFKLSGNEFIEFVEEFVNHINDHDYGFIYDEYRENKDLATFDESSERTRYGVVDEVFDMITKRCYFKENEEEV